ncbi:hypothetical protein FQN57_000082 [Myotisia sp. PD_48]|nr:hypothetical protein FQN57_000082 [Myotisia sp. PD_48]
MPPSSPDNTSATSEHLRLIAIAEKTLPEKCKPGTLAYCPTMDLVAVAMEDNHVHVFRLNGQYVFGGMYGDTSNSFDASTSTGNELSVVDVKWKNSGRFLAVACSDNTIRLMSTYTGKTIHILPCGPHPSFQDYNANVAIRCLGSGVNFAEIKLLIENLHNTQSKLSLEDILQLPDAQLASHLSFLKADLPRELALLDIEGSLPKLSTLPSTGDGSDVFSTRSSLDFLLHPTAKNPGDSVDILFAGLGDGSIHIRIFDCFDIGYVNVASSLPASNGIPGTEKYIPLLHASHAMTTSHSLLFSTNNRLSLVILDLSFITKAGRYLSVLASKVTQLQNLLRYINQVQKQIYLEWKNSQDLPGRFMNNIEEDLIEKCNSDFVTATYHLLVTGDCFEPLKEFLTDQLGQRGHKRWDKAVTTGYETLRKLIIECLLPALERCGVLFSRLMGLSKYHRINAILGLETAEIKDCVATVDCLNLMSHKILVHCNKEIQEFAAFSKWLQYEIEIQSTDPLSAAADELIEKADTIDYASTLRYVKDSVTRSAVQDFLTQPTSQRRISRGSVNLDWQKEGTYYDHYKKLVQRHESEKPSDRPVLPILSDLTGRLSRQCDTLFMKVAETQRRGVLHRSALKLSEACDASVMDMAMNFENSDNGSPSTYIASRSRKAAHIFLIYKAVIDTTKRLEPKRFNMMAMVDLRQGSIRDIKFVQDGTLMLLWFSKESETWHLLNIPYRVGSEGEYEMIKYSQLEDGVQLSTRTTTTRLDPEQAGIICHDFESDTEPLRLEVNGREGRRVVCVLYADRTRYSVFDMDSGWAGEEDDQEAASSESINRE